MDPEPNQEVPVDIVVAAIGTAAFDLLKSSNPAVRAAEQELQTRLHMLLEDQALIAARALAGLDVAPDQAILEARLKALGSAGVSIGQREIEAAVHGAITTALKVAFKLLV